MPGLTSDLKTLEGVVRAAADHGASFVGASFLRLAPGTRDHFLSYLEDAYPELLSTYKSLYPGTRAPQYLVEGTERLVAAIRQTTSVPDRLSIETRPRPLQPALGL